MLDSLKKRPGSLRWPPRQRFGTTETGKAALSASDESITLLRAAGRMERTDLEGLQAQWASQHGVDPADAAILGEFVGKEKLPREVQAALDDCGVSLGEVQAAVDRLFTAGLLAPAGGGGPIPPSERVKSDFE